MVFGVFQKVQISWFSWFSGFGCGNQQFGMVGLQHGLYRGIGGCTKGWFSGCFSGFRADLVVLLLLFGCCTLVWENTEIHWYGKRKYLKVG